MIKFRVHKVVADRDITKIKELAEKAELAPMTVSGLWNNSTLRVDLTTLNALCVALQCQPGDLMEYIAEAPSLKLLKKRGEALLRSEQGESADPPGLEIFRGTPSSGSVETFIDVTKMEKKIFREGRCPDPGLLNGLV